VEADVYVWRYAPLLAVHARKEEEVSLLLDFFFKPTKLGLVSCLIFFYFLFISFSFFLGLMLKQSFCL